MSELWKNYRKSHSPSTSEMFLANKIYSKAFFLRKDLRFFKKALPFGAKVLVIASSTFWLADRLKNLRKDLKIVCVDITSSFLSEIKYSFIVGNALNLPIRDSSIDALFCAYLIEHFSYPNNFFLFREINRVLKPGGYFYVETEGTSIMHFIDLPMYLGKDVELSFYDDPTHIRPYTRRSLKWLAKMANLQTLFVYRNIVWIKLLLSPLFLILGLFLRKTKFFSYIFSIFNSVSIIGFK